MGCVPAINKNTPTVDRKRGGGNASSWTIEPSMSFVLIWSSCLNSGGVLPGRRAGSGIGKYNAESSKQDSKRFDFITKRCHFAHLGILFSYGSRFLLHTRTYQLGFYLADFSFASAKISSFPLYLKQNWLILHSERMPHLHSRFSCARDVLCGPPKHCKYTVKNFTNDAIA